MRMPVLETDRLVVRPFVVDDLPAVHDLLDVQLGEAEVGTEGALSLEERERWLRWTVESYEGLPICDSRRMVTAGWRCEIPDSSSAPVGTSRAWPHSINCRHWPSAAARRACGRPSSGCTGRSCRVTSDAASPPRLAEYSWSGHSGCST